MSINSERINHFRRLRDIFSMIESLDEENDAKETTRGNWLAVVRNPRLVERKMSRDDQQEYNEIETTEREVSK